MSDFMKLVDDINNLKYEEKIIAFVDILGFKDLIANGSEIEFKSCLEELLLPSKEISEDIDFFIFSDCCYMSASIENAEKLLKVLLVLQGRMIKSSPKFIDALNSCFTHNRIFLIRGGVTVGRAMANRNLNICSGPAVVEAYELEALHAQSPRIMISNEAKDRIFTGTALDKYIKKDGEGQFFTDFKRYWLEQENMDFDEFVEPIDNIIDEKELKGCESVYKKYKWLKKYLFE